MRRTKAKDRLDDFIRASLGPYRDVPDSSVEDLWERVVERSRSLPQEPDVTAAPARFRPRFLIVAAGALFIFLSSAVVLRDSLFVKTDVVATDHETHRDIAAGEIVRSAENTNTQLLLGDGSVIEIRSGSELLVERAADGIRIRLHDGAVLLNVAKNGRGHLYVQSRDLEASVTGTIFLVTVETEGSRVAVVEGEVEVRIGSDNLKLHKGEQVKTKSLLTNKTLRELIGWSRSAEAYLALLEEPEHVESPPTPGLRKPQAPSKLSFEASSVRPTPEERLNHLQYERCTGGGRFIARGIPALWLIRFGYRVQDRAIVGAPEWSNEFDSGFDIEATPPRSVNEEECRAMVRSLLEERFGLRTHKETRESSVYALVRGAGPPKLREVRKDDSPGGVRINGAVMQAVSESQAPAGWSMDTLIGYISGFTGRRVVNKTNLPGLYSFSLDFAITEGDTRQGVFRAVQEQLGLRLESTKENVESLVIDHLERPTPN